MRKFTVRPAVVFILFIYLFHNKLPAAGGKALRQEEGWGRRGYCRRMTMHTLACSRTILLRSRHTHAQQVQTASSRGTTTGGLNYSFTVAETSPPTAQAQTQAAIPQWRRRPLDGSISPFISNLPSHSSNGRRADDSLWGEGGRRCTLE